MKRRCRRTVITLVMLAFGWLLVPGAVQAAADIPSDLPSSVLYYEPPPPGAPPAPPVPPVSSLVGVGNVPGEIINPDVTRPHTAFGGSDATPAGTSSSDCASFGERSHAVQWSYNFSNYIYADPFASNVWVSDLSREHAGLGIIGWFKEQVPDVSDMVQMGYWRGTSPTWTDPLGPDEVMIYMEFFRKNPYTYNWVPLLPVQQGTRHTFQITQDWSGHYYNFYLDGELKWANVYLDEIPNRAQIQNETQNFDGFCDGGYTDVNWTEPGHTRLRVEPGHAVMQPPSTPWRSFSATLERLLPQLGYYCGWSTSGYVWRCGPYEFSG